MVKATCNNVLWEVYIGVSGQGGAPTGSSPLLKINKSPTLCIYMYISCLYIKNNCVCVYQLRCAVCISGSHVQPVDGSLEDILTYMNQ